MCYNRWNRVAKYTMKTTCIKPTAQFVAFGVLITFAFAGCLTGLLLQHKHEPERVRTDIEGRKIAVVVLDEYRIGIFPERQDHAPFNNLATIYVFKKSDYASIKSDIERVDIREDMIISGKAIIRKDFSFVIQLKDKTLIEPLFLDATLANRSENEVLFDDKKIHFHRTVLGEEKINALDRSWLWKFPLLPIAMTADVALDPMITPMMIKNMKHKL